MSLAYSFPSPEIITCKWPDLRVTYMSTKGFGRQDNAPHVAPHSSVSIRNGKFAINLLNDLLYLFIWFGCLSF